LACADSTPPPVRTRGRGRRGTLAGQAAFHPRTARIAEETRLLGLGAAQGLPVAQNNDFFAAVVWPGASNDTSRLQLMSVATDGTPSTYATAEIDQKPVFARLRSHATDVAVAYLNASFKLAVAAWRLAAPGSGAAARTVLASKAGLEMPTQFRLATLVPQDADAPVKLFTLVRAPSGKLGLICWSLKFTQVFVPAGGGTVGVGPKLP